MAKKLFYVCAGLLCIALAYHLGATSATAQAPETYVVGSFDVDTDPTVIDSNGNMWAMGWSNSRGSRIGPIALPKPGRVLAVSVSVVAGSHDTRLLYDDGDAYIFDRTAWQFIGNVAGGATPALRESWGAVKQRYR